MNGLLETAAPKPTERVEALIAGFTETLAAALRQEGEKIGQKLSDEAWAEMREDYDIKEKLADAAAKAAIMVCLDELHARIRKLEGPTVAEVKAMAERLHGPKASP